MKRLFAAIVCTLIALKGFAQYAEVTDSVIIRGNRLQTPLAAHNRSIRIITAKEIQALPVKSIAEVLAYASGVDVRQRGPWGTQADISIDGSTFDQVVVLVNGVKMSDPQTGHNMMNLPVPLVAIDHIEVIRGAAAAAYGVNALAGAINIVTVTPGSNTITAQAYAGSSFKQDTANGETYVGWGAQAAAGLHTAKTAQLIGLAYDAGNGYRYNTAFKAYRLYYQNDVRLSSKAALSAAAGYVNNDYGASLYYAAPKDVEATENVQTLTGTLAVNYRPVSSWTITPRLSWRYNKDNYIFIRQKPDVYHNVHETNVATGELQAGKTLAHGYFGTGFELRNETISSNNLGHRARVNTGLFAEYRHTFSSAVQAGAGLYANYNSDYGLRAYPAADIGYSFAPHWKLFANGGLSQRLPTFTDLYYVGPTNTGNAALRPEEAAYTEGGIKFTTAAQQFGLQYAYRHITNFIDWVRGDAQSAWQPQNFGVMNTQVFSANAAQSLDALLGMAPDRHLRLMASWNYLSPSRAGVEGALSKYATDALRHQLIAGIQTAWGARFLATLNVRYQQRISNGDYTLADLHLQYSLTAWQVFADVNNLTDAQYTETGTMPLPGRWVSLGVRFKSRQ